MKPDLTEEQQMAWKLLSSMGIKAPSEFIPRYPASRILAVLYTMRLRGKSIGWLIGALKGDWEMETPHPGWDPFDPRRSLYSRADADRLLARRKRGRRAAQVAENACHNPGSIPTHAKRLHQLSSRRQSDQCQAAL